MGVTTIKRTKPIRYHGEFTLGNGSSNATDLWLCVTGCTDLTIQIHNTHASAGMTVSVDWCMAPNAEDLLVDAIGSDPTIAANASDRFRFASALFKWTDEQATPITYKPSDPYFADVLPCSWIVIKMYGTSAESKAKVWVQGHKRRL